MKTIKSFVSLLLVLMLVLCQCGFALAETFTPGTYTATAQGRNGDLTVQVSFTADAIAAVEVTQHSETQGLADPALERLPRAIMDAQSVQIDTVSGATITSEAILAAVADCILQAGADPMKLAPLEAVAREKKLTAGQYQATAHGHHSDITVETIVTSDAIQSVTVTASGDNMHIGDAAIEQMPTKITAAQSVAVDTVAGATFTSRAITAAVTDCLRQAGGDEAVLAFSAPVADAPYSTEEKTEAFDVVVVGSGLTGVCAALSAQEKGASVAILEKLSYFGGISQTSAGCFKYSTQFDENGVSDYYKYLLYKSTGLMQDDAAKINEYLDIEACKILAAQAEPTGQWLNDLGATVAWIPNYPDDNGRYMMGFGIFNDGVHTEPDNCAAAIDKLMKRFIQNGGKLYLEMPAVSLMTDASGAVNGVVAHGRDGRYTFSAKAVCLCCGGFGNSPEMIAQLAPAFTGEIAGATCAGSTGDGIRMAQEIGAAVYDDQFMMGGSGHTFITDFDRIQPFADAETPKQSLYVNSMGQRVNSEDPMSYTPAITYCNPDAQDYYWAIMNEEVANTFIYSNAYQHTQENIVGAYIDLINQGIANGQPGIYKANSLGELANMIKVVPSTLIYTVNHYNLLCEAGEDTDLFKNPAYLVAMKEGPWYAVKATMEFFGTVGGVVTDVNAAVLKEDGTTIPGLFAAGETSNHKVLTMSYSGGVSVSENIVFGKIAGESAAKTAGFGE